MTHTERLPVPVVKLIAHRLIAVTPGKGWRRSEWVRLDTGERVTVELAPGYRVEPGEVRRWRVTDTEAGK